MSMVVSKTALGRRTFLRGMGTALALPLLDAMVPAFTATAKTAAKAVPRLGFFYLPNGAVHEGPAPQRLTTYEVRVEGDELQIKWEEALAPDAVAVPIHSWDAR